MEMVFETAIAEFVASVLVVLIFVFMCLPNNNDDDPFQQAGAGELQYLARRGACAGVNFVKKMLPEALQSIVQIYGAQLDPVFTVTMAFCGAITPFNAALCMVSQALASLSVLGPAIWWQPAVRERLTASAVSTPRAIFLREVVHIFHVFSKLGPVAPLQEAAAYTDFMLRALQPGLLLGARVNPTWTLIIAITTGNYSHVRFTILAQLLGIITGFIAYTLWRMFRSMYDL